MATRTKKPVSKKRPTHKKKSSVKPNLAYKSLRLEKSEEPFLSFKITRQTVYWIILVAFIIFIQLWILKVQYEVVQVTDQLDQQLQTSK